MPRESPNRQRWITLGTASELLGVSESTIRRWADAGEIRSYRTSGGHRRILEEDLQGIVASTQAASSARDSNRISDLTMARVKRRLHPRGRSAPMAGLGGLSPDGLDRLRLLGRQVVDLFSRFISGDLRKERATEDVRSIGREYGRTLVGEKMGLTTAVTTFNSLRRTIEETASQIASEAGLSTEEAVEAIEAILELSDVMLEGMASVYEATAAR
ncbi:MAG TPA: helix-turn-helix domain-containing protein [Tepidiformaceae bacterium]|nr:helix-turn-helix domain-containing protein [Tepidiformaceae bacterium]